MTMFQNLNRSMAQGDTLKIECEPCERRATWTKAEACRRLGPDATPYDVRRRLACAACGATPSRVWI